MGIAVRRRELQRARVGSARALRIGRVDLAAEAIPRVGVALGSRLRSRRSERPPTGAPDRTPGSRPARNRTPAVPTPGSTAARSPARRARPRRRKTELAEIAFRGQRRAQARQRAAHSLRRDAALRQITHPAQERELAKAEAQLAALAALRIDEPGASERAHARLRQSSSCATSRTPYVAPASITAAKRTSSCPSLRRRCALRVSPLARAGRTAARLEAGSQRLHQVDDLSLGLRRLR